MEYLSEHQGAPKDAPDGDNYDPNEQELADIKLVEKFFERYKKGRGKYDEKWPDYYGMYRGRQWKEQRPSYRHSEVINLIFREIQTSVPIQMDSRPKFEYLPMEPGDIELAEIINQVCEADWNRYNWLAQITECAYDANIFGTGIAGCYFDKTKELGVGAICIESEDVFYHFPDPNAKDFNKRMIGHIKAEPMDIEAIKAKWPNGKYVKPDVISIQKMDVGGQDKVRVQSPVEASVMADGSQQFDKDHNPQALVITLFLDGAYEIEEKEEKSDDGLEVKYVQSKKYPKGRKIVVASKVVLESGERDNEDGKIPYGRLQNYVNQRQFWGISDVEQLESPQKTFNKLVSFSLDVLTLMGNPVWMVPSSSGVDTENLFNQPGLIVEYDGDKAPTRQEGVQLQPYVLQLIDRMRLWFDDVSGQQDVSRGAKPEGITAASAIQSLQEAAQTSIRQKSRNMDAFLQDLGQLYADNVFQYYTAPRVFRLTNKDGAMKFFKFHVEPQADGKKVVKYRPYNPREDGGLAEGIEKTVPVSGALDVKVNTGSSLPFAKDADRNEALQLFDRQIIDDEEVLKRFDYPNWEAVLQRVNEKKAAAAEAEAQAKASAVPA